ncbi:TPA: LPXTG cell wall anchor domain-containing protein [Streptococcus suis]
MPSTGQESQTSLSLLGGILLFVLLKKKSKNNHDTSCNQLVFHEQHRMKSMFSLQQSL